MRIAALREMIAEKVLDRPEMVITNVHELTGMRGIKNADIIRINALFPRRGTALRKFLEESQAFRVDDIVFETCFRDPEHGFGLDLGTMESACGSGPRNFCQECLDNGQTCANLGCAERFERDPETGQTAQIRENGLCDDCHLSGYYRCTSCAGIHSDQTGRASLTCVTCRRTATGVVMMGYHHTQDRQRLIPDRWSMQNGGRMLGFELEVECGNDAKRQEFMLLMKDHFGVLLRGFERDGSLSVGGGVEMITQATGLPAIVDKAVSIPRIKGVKSHDTTTCGLHVHVSREGLTIADEARIVGLFSSTGMTEFLQGMARRPFNDYCRQLNRRTVAERCGYDCGGLGNLVSHKKAGRRVPKATGHFDHHAVDFSHEKTVEFRLFRGTLFGESIAACLEFSNAVVSFARLGGNPLKNVAAEEFMAFVNSPRMATDTKLLRKYVETNVPKNIAKARLGKPLPEGFVGPVINKKVMREQACA
jgi:hypothetical protein